MKKYNKPEIEALALETVDVIAVSTASAQTLEVLAGMDGVKNVQAAGTNETITEFDTTWQW